MTDGFPNLLSSMDTSKLKLKNRIMTSGHQTTLVHDHLPTEDFKAYHLERAKGGCGLIVLEAHGIHKSGLNTPYAIDATDPNIIDIYSDLTEKVHQYGTKIFAQLLHNGSEAYLSDEITDVVSASNVPTERFHIIPRELEEEEIEEIIEGFVTAAIHLKQAGLDGVELAGSHNYLFAQFWNPRTNKRTDKWGGSFTNRLRFAKEVMTRVRQAVGDNFVVGMRISLESKDDVGTNSDESYEIIKYLNELHLLDYWSLVIGSSSTLKGSSFIVPPSNNNAFDLFSKANEIKDLISPLPLIVTSRIYKPDIAEKIIKEDKSDVVGMTRALIADPHLPNKILKGKSESIIPCIACNQGCIDRYQKHLPIRCTVNPVTGRERTFSSLENAGSTKQVLVAGGGPAGIMAAITARKRGHNVTIIEEKDYLGGQLNVISGGLYREQTNDWRNYLLNEVERLEINTQLGKRFHHEDFSNKEVDTLILATGSNAAMPETPLNTSFSVYSSWDVLNKQTIKEESILVIDWKGDWPGVEAAEKLASQGKDVEIVSQTYGIGEGLQQYLRNELLKRLDQYNVKQTPNFKLADIGQNEIILKHLFSAREEMRQPQAVVFAVGSESAQSMNLYRELKGKFSEIYRVGDALSPRSLDEATWEGFKVASEI
ncbi:FAD-dependent oxidoreductase [Lentibacillus lipolyticus]|nr:FAD-dependent oxidoreductase [Lentibacillus lipolyticus]